MNQFFNMIVNTIKYRFAAISARLRYWTNANYIKTRVINRFQQWLAGLFNVKPRNKKDYYTFLGIMVSRRLAHVVILCVGLICLGYLWLVKPFQSLGSDGTIKTYKYNSWPLKFMDADVNITAKRGYIAYTGHVKGGYAQGQGELFDPDGGLVYSGEFSKNMYNGTGKQYYPNGQLHYEGSFVDNLYQGKGKLYRPGGALYYSGEFKENYQDGQGELYNIAEQKVFGGVFKRGELIYTQLLGKTVEEINAAYTGSKKLYEYSDESMIAMNEISALYIPASTENSLDTTAKAQTLYVIRDVFVSGDKRIETVSQLKEHLGEPQFEGNSYMNFYDAAAIQWCQDNGKDIALEPNLEYTEEYDEYVQVDGFDGEALIYMYVYEINDLSYTFIAVGHEDKFFMYTISV